MPQIICKLPNDNFLLWSTVVDAPVSYGLPRAEFDAFMKEEYGARYMRDDHAKRMERAEKFGTSSMIGPGTLEDLIECNRAGENETALTLQEIVEKYGVVPPNTETPDE